MGAFKQNWLAEADHSDAERVSGTGNRESLVSMFDRRIIPPAGDIGDVISDLRVIPSRDSPLGIPEFRKKDLIRRALSRGAETPDRGDTKAESPRGNLLSARI